MQQNLEEQNRLKNCFNLVLTWILFPRLILWVLRTCMCLFCVSWLNGVGNGLTGLQIYDPMSQNGHGRKEGSGKCALELFSRNRQKKFLKSVAILNICKVRIFWSRKWSDHIDIDKRKENNTAQNDKNMRYPYNPYSDYTLLNIK